VEILQTKAFFSVKLANLSTLDTNRAVKNRFDKEPSKIDLTTYSNITSINFDRPKMGKKLRLCSKNHIKM
jgi:hypothetical protein